MGTDFEFLFKGVPESKSELSSPISSTGPSKAEWSGWRQRDNTLYMTYKFTPAAHSNRPIHIHFSMTVVHSKNDPKQGIERIVHIFIKPQLVYQEGFLLAGLATLHSETTGFVAVRALVAEEKATCLEFLKKQDTNDIFRVLSRGEDVLFIVRDNTEEIVRLLLHNDPSFMATYAAVENSLFD